MTRVASTICNNAKLCSSYNEPVVNRARMHKAAAAAE